MVQVLPARHIPIGGGGRFGHDEYTHYYYAQAMYILGDDGYAKLFPETREGRAPDLEQVPQGHVRQPGPQPEPPTAAGPAATIGPVFTTAVHLTILQLDNGSAADLPTVDPFSRDAASAAVAAGSRLRG